MMRQRNRIVQTGLMGDPRGSFDVPRDRLVEIESERWWRREQGPNRDHHCTASGQAHTSQLT